MTAVPSANVEIVRRAYEALGRFESIDLDRVLELYDSDHVLTTDWGAGDEKTYRGLEGYRLALEENGEMWDDFRNEVEEVMDAGDDVVVAVIRASGRGKASGTPVRRQSAAVIRLRAGRIVSTHYHVSLEAAFKAADLDR